MLANVHMLRATNHTKSLFTTLRDRTTSRPDFIFTTERLARLIVEEALGLLPSHSKTVTTPVGESYEGIEYARSICGVAIIRAGEAMEAALRTVCRAVRIGKILIQRNMETGERELIYVRLPPDISERYVLLLEPVLASGRSATKAVEVLLEQGVSEEKILFTSLLAAHAGLRLLLTRFPKLKIVCGEIDAEYDGLCASASRAKGKCYRVPVFQQARRSELASLVFLCFCVCLSLCACVCVCLSLCACVRAGVRSCLRVCWSVVRKL